MMPDYLNVFEHQRFRLLRPDGEAVERSFRDLLTGPDEPLRFGYGHEYLNVAALGLCAALAQAAFEPETVGDLSDRLAEPMGDADFDATVAPLRARFTIDGPPGTRFLQGRPPKLDTKGRPSNLKGLTELLPVTNLRQTFLNRPTSSWVVQKEQVPLLLFGRHTFYEKSAGRGYLTGTSGDLEIRTYLLDRSTTPSLRRSVWLNVLTRDEQDEHSDEYDDEVDGWMWTDDRDAYPDEVVRGTLRLRAGLLWMVADTWVVFDELEEPRVCVVTGDRLGEGDMAGVDVAVQASGRGYGVKASKEAGRDSFFLHPAAPYRTVTPKKGDSFRVHLSADETRGLVGEAAGLFFAGGQSDRERPAPAVYQLYAPSFDSPPVDLLTFGFQMVGAKANVHGGYAVEQFHYPTLHGDDLDAALGAAHELVSLFVKAVRDMEGALAYAIQLCTLVKMDANEEESGRLSFTPKERLKADTLSRDAVQALWSHAGTLLHTLLRLIEEAGTAPGLAAHHDAISTWTKQAAAWHTRDLFWPVFDQHSLSPVHLVAAHRAKESLLGALKKIAGTVPGPLPDPPAITSEPTPATP